MGAKVDFFSTDHEENSERVHYWNKISSKVVGSADVRPLKRRIEGKIERRNFGMIQTINIDSTPAIVESLGDKRFNGVFVLKNHHGLCHVEQNGVRHPFNEQSLSIIRADEPYRISSDSRHNMRIMYIPNKQLANRLHDYLVEPIPYEDCQLIQSFIDKLITLDISKITSSNLLHTAMDLIELEWPHKTKLKGRSNAGHRLEALHEYIDFHLSDPSLGLEEIAESLRITPRYIQKLLAECNTSLSKTICEKRLLLAREYLVDTSKNITDIAIMCGFSDISYFCRSFKNRFNMTAREFRNSARDKYRSSD